MEDVRFRTAEAGFPIEATRHRRLESGRSRPGGSCCCVVWGGGGHLAATPHTRARAHAPSHHAPPKPLPTHPHTQVASLSVFRDPMSYSGHGTAHHHRQPHGTGSNNNVSSRSSSSSLHHRSSRENLPEVVTHTCLQTPTRACAHLHHVPPTNTRAHFFTCASTRAYVYPLGV